MPWYKKTIRSGNLLEVRTYFATRDGRAIARGENREETPEDMAAQNQRRAEMELMRLVACNFGGAMGGGSYTFTSSEDIDETQAMKRERNLLDRIKRARRKAGLEPLRYIAVTEKQGKWHHHIIMQDDMSLQALEEIWAAGQPGRRRVSARAMGGDADTYREVARYLLGTEKQSKTGRPEAGKPERRKWQRRWHASKGLRRPVVEKVEVKRTPRVGTPKPPKGYRLLPEWQVGCDMLGNLYTYYAAIREEPEGVLKKGSGRKGSGRSPAGWRAEPSGEVRR